MRAFALIAGALVACTSTPPDCGEGYTLSSSGGCMVDFAEGCPDGQVRTADGSCVDPFFNTTRDTSVDSGRPVDSGDTDVPRRGDACAWVVVTEVVQDPGQVGWQIRDAEAGIDMLTAAPGAFSSVGTHRSTSLLLDEGVQYQLRALDLGADGWGAGAGVRVELAADPFRVAMSNTLAAGSEGTFPFNVLCPAE